MRLYLSIVFFLISSTISFTEEGRESFDLPAIETFITEPMVIENVSIWVPAVRSGPFINRSCVTKENLTFSSVLPAAVKHIKTKPCPEQLARVLAELTSFYHSQSLPLTIFNGWQWECTYSICQYESVSYDLARKGSCWENGWEAIMNLSCGAIRMQLIELESLEKFNTYKTDSYESIIEVKTFSSMRTRDGYPKERQL